ncbi:MAG: hypothetical protein KC766_24845 [Myxococcales bacterium]|nr:hypothetical protein [Myxococcales bacterium]
MHRWLGVLGLLFLLSCASSKLVLQQPLNEQCQGLSLKGCPELTDGVLAYVDGDQATGDAKLEAAVEANGPGRMREFAEKLRQLEDLPGSDSFMGPIRQIIAKLEGGGDASPASDEEPEAPIVRAKDRLASAGRGQVSADEDEDDDGDEDEPSSRRAAPYATQKAAAAVEPMASDAAHYLSGTIMATSDTTGGRCETPLTGLAGVGDRSLCTKAVAGPMVLTDLYAGGSCPAEVYLVVSDFSAIRLVLPIPARTPLHQTGARISIGPLEHLSVVAIKRSESDDPRCAVTWSAWKP